MVMTLASLSFARRFNEGPRIVRVVYRVLLICALFYVAIGAWSAYRAWVQVRQLDLKLITTDIRPGVMAVVSVVTSGRTPIDVRLELVQGPHSEMLSDLRVSASHDGFLDPRARHGTMMPSFTADFLAHFQPGPAIVRATALGRPQWMRTPPPVVRELPVVIAPPGR
jgi:hypothetical protein